MNSQEIVESVDRKWMRAALHLAERGFTPPNPMVGCVIVRQGELVGAGYHLLAGEPHAEVMALRDAGDCAQGATVYVSLEPCSHWGRTPPCADALIEARVGRVVAAISDPNPNVGGRGIEKLRAAGIPVTVGLLGEQAQALNASFFHFQRTGTPHVTLKIAQSLDGKIATRDGDSQWITGVASRRHVHRLRARSSAVLTGIGTVVADDPLLTARLKPESLRQPLRVVVDSNLRTPSDSALVRSAADRPEWQPVLIATTDSAHSALERQLARPGIEIVRFPAASDGRVDLHALLAELGRREIISVFCEGGAELNSELLNLRLVDRLLVFMAPKLIGGRGAPGPVGGMGISLMGDAPVVTIRRLRRFGPDIAIEADCCRNEVH